MTEIPDDILKAARVAVSNELFMLSAVYGSAVTSPSTIETVARAILAERQRMVAMYSWRPIETAPKDGTNILAPSGYGFLDVMCFSDGYWRETGNFMKCRKQPTHWMRLPLPPKDTAHVPQHQVDNLPPHGSVAENS